MNANTNLSTATAAVERVNTLALLEGDIVRAYGMRILLGARSEEPCPMDGLESPVRVWFHGTVLNTAELADGVLVPVGFRTDSRCTSCEPGEHWTVAGNERAEWLREVRATA